MMKVLRDYSSSSELVKAKLDPSRGNQWTIFTGDLKLGIIRDRGDYFKAITMSPKINKSLYLSPQRILDDLEEMIIQ